MTPEHTGYSILAFVLERLGTTPILLFLTIVLLGPWVMTVWLEWKRDKRNTKILARQDKRFEEVVQMYEHNVDLVKNYEKITVNLQDLVIVTTSTMQTLVDHIKNNLFCPFMRPPERAEAVKGKTHE